MESCLPLVESCEMFSCEEWVGNRSPLCDGEGSSRRDIRGKERVNQNNQERREAVVVYVVVQRDGGWARQPFLHNSAMFLSACMFIPKRDVWHLGITASTDKWCGSVLVLNCNLPSGPMAGDLIELRCSDPVFGRRRACKELPVNVPYCSEEEDHQGEIACLTPY